MPQRRFTLRVSIPAAIVIGALRLPWSTAAQEATIPTAEYPIAVGLTKGPAILVLDQEGGSIFKVEPPGGLHVLRKGSNKYGLPLYRPAGIVADDDGNLFITDPGSLEVWRLSPDGNAVVPLTAKAPEPGPGMGAAGAKTGTPHTGKLDIPMGIALDAEGNVVVADLGMNAVLRISRAGGEPVVIGQVNAPRGIARDSDGSFLILSQVGNQLVRLTPEGKVTPVVKGALASPGVVSFPQQVAVAPWAYVVSDNYAQTIWRVSRDGSVRPLAQGDPLRSPTGIAVHPDGSVLVVDPAARALFKITSDGKVSKLVSF